MMAGIERRLFLSRKYIGREKIAYLGSRLDELDIGVELYETLPLAVL